MPFMLEQVRVTIPEDQIFDRGKAGIFFDFLPNNQNLTEEYLYAHQPMTPHTIPVYSTAPEPIGILDDNQEVRNRFSVIQAPVIVVARKGYAGRLFVIEKWELIVHEDAYAARPKPLYQPSINLDWFAGHYSFEFQANRTSFWGIGDFPRERFRNMDIIIPKREFQDAVADLYLSRQGLLQRLERLKEDTTSHLDDIITRYI